MNSICLVGNICNDLELKSTNSGKSVCSFNLAVRRPFAKDVTDFITIVVWNKQADNLVKFCGKGSKIGVTGVLTTRKYQDKDGNNRTAFEVVAETVEFLETKTATPNAEGSAKAHIEREPADDDGFVPVNDPLLPFADDDCPF